MTSLLCEMLVMPVIHQKKTTHIGSGVEPTYADTVPDFGMAVPLGSTVILTVN